MDLQKKIEMNYKSYSTENRSKRKTQEKEEPSVMAKKKERTKRRREQRRMSQFHWAAESKVSWAALPN